MARRIDLRQDFTDDDDVLPERCHQDLRTTTPHFNTKRFFAQVKEGVYQEW